MEPPNFGRNGNVPSGDSEESPPTSGEVPFSTPNNMSYYDFVERGEKDQIDKWLDMLDEAYYYATALISNDIYDALVKIYENRFGKRLKVRSKPTHDVVKYPIAMMSLDKIKEEKELQSFLMKNPGSYVVMSKVNGNCALYGSNFLYYGGKNSEGVDVTHLLQYLKLPKIPEGIYVKGELVIDKNDYEPFKEEYKTNLSMIAGLLNSRSADPQKLKLFKFIAYDMTCNMPMSQIIPALHQHGFQTPFATKVDGLSIEWLSALYKQRKQLDPYDIDGLVIATDRPVSMDERMIEENPTHICAFKEYGQLVVATVIDVVWRARKHKMIKPVVVIQPVVINNFTIKKLTAFNAGWVATNNVGPGTQLLITHNTIPHILSVIQGTYAALPPNPETWKWNETGVDVILLKENDMVRVARIYEFFKQIGAKYVGETTLEKLYYAGFTSVKAILEAGEEGLLRANVSGIGEGIVNRMLKNIHNALITINLPRLMSASCEFGRGFGVRKLVLITNTYPNILFQDVTIQQVMNIQGFAEKTATKFVKRLPKFRQWLANMPVLIQYYQVAETHRMRKIQEMTQQSQVQQNNVESVAGKTFVFTGFRDKNLEETITGLGGKVTTSVSGNTSFVVVGGAKGIGSGKEKEAIKRRIPVINLEELRARFGL